MPVDCAPFPELTGPVSGPVSRHDENIVLYFAAPHVGRQMQGKTGVYAKSALDFDFVAPVAEDKTAPEIFGYDLSQNGLVDITRDSTATETVGQTGFAAAASIAGVAIPPAGLLLLTGLGLGALAKHRRSPILAVAPNS